MALFIVLTINYYREQTKNARFKRNQVARGLP